MAKKNAENVSRHRKIDGFDIFVFITLTVLFLILIIPFWSIIVTSFSTNEAYIKQPFSLWPKEFTWANYISVFARGSGLLVAYKNTIIVSAIGTVLGMVVMTMAAYALSRQFIGKRVVFMYFLCAMFFSGGTIPTYLNIKNLGLNNTFTGIIMLTLCSVGHVIILMKGFEGIPKELEESALIDGATQVQTFYKVMIPLNKPVIATYSLFTFVDLWNGWYWPTLLLTDSKKNLLQVYLRAILGANNILKAEAGGVGGGQTFAIGVQMASVFAVILPIMLIYPFIQKYFVKGIMVGSVKM